MLRSGVTFALVLAVTVPALGQVTQVVPPDRENTVGGTGFIGPLSNSVRKYQLLMHEDQLTGLAGLQLTGITYRLLPAASAAWPAADISYADYEIWLSDAVDPANRTSTFATNIVGPQTQVRDGQLNIAAGSFPSGGSPNDFGVEIKFDTPYLYAGGNLAIELRHGGFSGTSSSVDAVGTAGAGYGTGFAAYWSSNLAAVTGSNGNFAILEISAVPEPGSLALGFVGAAFLTLRRRRAA